MTHRIEFRGLPSPFADPVVQRRLATRQMTKDEHDAVWRMEQRRQMQGFTRFPDVTHLVITPESFEALREAQIKSGRKSVRSLRPLSQAYEWGPRNFVTDVDEADLESLFGIHLAHTKAFVDLDTIVVSR